MQPQLSAQGPCVCDVNAADSTFQGDICFFRVFDFFGFSFLLSSVYSTCELHFILHAVAWTGVTYAVQRRKWGKVALFLLMASLLFAEMSLAPAWES